MHNVSTITVIKRTIIIWHREQFVCVDALCGRCVHHFVVKWQYFLKSPGKHDLKQHSHTKSSIVKCWAGWVSETASVKKKLKTEVNFNVNKYDRGLFVLYEYQNNACSLANEHYYSWVVLAPWTFVLLFVKKVDVSVVLCCIWWLVILSIYSCLNLIRR